MNATEKAQPTGSTIRMPTWFIPHGGGPCFFMDWNPPHAWNRMAAFLKGVAATLPQRPEAIVVISAHWLESGFNVTSDPKPALLYDYYGFPPHTYALRYPASGEPRLASRITDLLGQANLASHADPNRGFDHGMFVPLMLMFPDADIPVVQVSLRRDLDPDLHWQAGRSLAPLRDEGVLILGSGMSFHNMRGYGDPRFGPISDQFDGWLTAAVQEEASQRHQLLVDWAQAPAARLSHPLRAEEHLLPLMVVAGAAIDQPGQRVFSDRVMETTLSAFRFG